MIRINFNDIYEPDFISNNLQNFTFRSELKNNIKIELKVIISEHPDKYLPNVFNLAFGPLNEKGDINDDVKLKHKNVNKVFSTVLLFAITFLAENTTKSYSIGIDGSNEIRAYLYHRMFRFNSQQLSDSIIIVGVDWYVKLLRNQSDIERDDKGFPLFKPRPEPFDLDRKANDLYRYYLFALNT